MTTLRSNCGTKSMFCNDCEELSETHRCNQWNEWLRVCNDRQKMLPVKCKPCYERSTINPTK